MKFIVLTFSFLLSVAAFANTCENGSVDGTIAWQTVTTIGRAETIINPYVYIGCKPVPIYGNYAYLGVVNGAAGFCRALGLETGTIGTLNKQSAGSLLAQFRSADGELANVFHADSDSIFSLGIVTCLKKAAQ